MNEHAKEWEEFATEYPEIAIPVGNRLDRIEAKRQFPKRMRAIIGAMLIALALASIFPPVVEYGYNYKHVRVIDGMHYKFILEPSYGDEAIDLRTYMIEVVAIISIGAAFLVLLGRRRAQ